jgi:hypothetical protein
VSTWLNSGVPAPQVTARVGHSVDVLLRVYAKCIAVQEEVARRRIDEALRDDHPRSRPPSDRDQLAKAVQSRTRPDVAKPAPRRRFRW